MKYNICWHISSAEYAVAVICLVNEDAVTDFKGFLHHRTHTRRKKCAMPTYLAQIGGLWGLPLEVSSPS